MSRLFSVGCSLGFATHLATSPYPSSSVSPTQTLQTWNVLAHISVQYWPKTLDWISVIICRSMVIMPHQQLVVIMQWYGGISRSYTNNFYVHVLFVFSQCCAIVQKCFTEVQTVVKMSWQESKHLATLVYFHFPNGKAASVQRDVRMLLRLFLSVRDTDY